MSSERVLDIHCSCGAVHLRYRGVPIRHFICHCKHCQASMAWLESQGGTSSRHPTGGDQTLFVFSDDIEVVTGEDQIGAYSVIRRVRTPRIYARCCHTPLGSTFAKPLGRFTALKTVGVRDKSALPAIREHVNVDSAAGTLADDGLPRQRGMGPLMGQIAWELRPWSGHHKHRWARWTRSELIILEGDPD